MFFQLKYLILSFPLPTISLSHKFEGVVSLTFLEFEAMSGIKWVEALALVLFVCFVIWGFGY